MPRRSPDAITSHLLADLSEDARQLFDAAALPGEPGSRVHEQLHARLSAVTRSLRTIRPGIPLHAAACVVPDGRGLLIAGRTRAGKSTLVALLGAERGAAVLSDDTVWLIGADVSGIGAPLAIREGSPLWDTALAQWYADSSSRLLVRGVDIGAAPARHVAHVDVIAFPAFSVGAVPEVSSVSPADAFARLTTSLLRSCSDPELMEIAMLAAQHPAVEISYGDPQTALKLLDKALEGPSAPVTQEVAWLEPDKLTAAGLRSDVRGIRFGADCSLWSTSLARVAHVRGWAAETVCDNPLATQLRSLGLLAHGKATTTDADAHRD